MIFYYKSTDSNVDVFYTLLEEKFHTEKLKIDETNFANNEMYFQILSHVSDEDYAILNFANDLNNSQSFIRCALIINLLSKLTKNIILYMPYLPYELQSEYKKNFSVGFDIITLLFDKDYIKKIITLNSHASSIERKFSNTKIINIDIIEDLLTENLDIFSSSVTVLPDNGAKIRYEKLLQKFSLKYITLNKTRDFDGNVKIQSIIDTKLLSQNRFIFLDDMMISGKTLDAALTIINNISLVVIAKNLNQDFNKRFPSIKLITPSDNLVFSKVLNIIDETVKS